MTHVADDEYVVVDAIKNQIGKGQGESNTDSRNVGSDCSARILRKPCNDCLDNADPFGGGHRVVASDVSENLLNLLECCSSEMDLHALRKRANKVSSSLAVA